MMPPDAAGDARTGRGEHVAAPGVLVILHASGDLTKRLLMPAIYNLACDGLLPDDDAVVGMARRAMTTDDFRGQQRQDIARFHTRRTFDEQRWQWLESRLHYGPGVKADGTPAVGYREEPNVDPHSGTPTFAALKLHLDNDRWTGMPVYLPTSPTTSRAAGGRVPPAPSSNGTAAVGTSA